MIPDALSPYEQALSSGEPLGLCDTRGRYLELDIVRYLADVDETDETVLQRCAGPVLDVGCGPGRVVGALNERGVAALGVDIAEGAIDLSLQRGAMAMTRDVFARIPGEGRWRTLLLLDGNVGIGGDLMALIRRAVELLDDGGRLILEASSATPGTHDVLTARFSVAGEAVGEEFGWTVASVDVLAEAGELAGLVAYERWDHGGRQFLALAPATSTAKTTRAAWTTSTIPKLAT